MLASSDDIVRIHEKGYAWSTAKWPSNQGVYPIPVCWEKDPGHDHERGWVRDAVTKSWQEHSLVKFRGWGECAERSVGIRVAVRDDGGNDGPHTLSLGKMLDGHPGGMVLNFTFQTWSQVCAAADRRELCIRSIAVHEFGHAIGFAHEQNRPDKPGECVEKPQGPNGDILLTPYDPKSVMNYCNPVYNNDGALSDSDIDAVGKFYDGH